MDSGFTLKALSYGIIGLLWITLLVLSLVSIRKERRYDEPLRGLFSLTLIVCALCAFIVLSSITYHTTRFLRSFSPRVQTEIAKSDYHSEP